MDGSTLKQPVFNPEVHQLISWKRTAIRLQMHSSELRSTKPPSP